jgi:protein phosphatase
LRHIGGAPHADIRHMELHNGDQLLLCSDGLSDLVADPQIGQILKTAATAQAACDKLVAAALAGGGKDNVTVVLARYAWQA